MGSGPDAGRRLRRRERRDHAAGESSSTSSKPLPSYASGKLKIVDYRLTRDGDTALVIHRNSEDEVFSGHPLHADYLTTETWVRLGGDWRSLALIHTYAVAKDPPAVTLPAPTLDRYVGRYRMAPEVVYVVRREGDHLVGGREGRPAKPLLARNPPTSSSPPARPGRARSSCRRTEEGLRRFIDRREGEDLVYERIADVAE